MYIIGFILSCLVIGILSFFAGKRLYEDRPINFRDLLKHYEKVDINVEHWKILECKNRTALGRNVMFSVLVEAWDETKSMGIHYIYFPEKSISFHQGIVFLKAHMAHGKGKFFKACFLRPNYEDCHIWFQENKPLLYLVKNIR